MLENTLNPSSLPEIPDKRYFTIGEVSALCQVKSHVLRYWEQEFRQLNPVRRGKRRYYRRNDVLLIRKIRTLLYEKRFTIDGARHQLSARKTRPPVDTQVQDKPVAKKPEKDKGFYQKKIREVVQELEQLLKDIG